jgi:hypothetical protein
LKSSLERKFCLHKRDVQCSDYVSTHLNIMLFNEGKDFSKYEYISKIQDTLYNFLNMSSVLVLILLNFSVFHVQKCEG